MEASEVRDPAFWGRGECTVLAPPRLEAEGAAIQSQLAREEAVVFASSGSGGVPKWTLFRREALLASAAAVNRHLEVIAEDRWLLALPIFHVGGFGVAARAFAADCELHRMAGRWQPMRFVEELEANGSTLTSLVPTQVHDLVACELCAPDALRALVVGGARLDEDCGQAARALGWPVLQSYGMTEAGSQVATDSLENLEAEFCHSPLPILSAWEYRLGDDGCLQLRGEALAESYLQFENEALFHERLVDDDGWFATTDLVEIESNLLTVIGRADRRVKVLGEMVDVQELEEEVRGHLSSNGEIHIHLVPDERRGWRLVPIVEGDESGVEDVIAIVNDRRPGYARLEVPMFVEKMPRTALGKIDGAALGDKFGGR